MADNNAAPTKWSETEKLGFILQIAAKVGKIPWNDLELPPGRTQKACQVMLDKEKAKIKKAGETLGTSDAGEDSPAKTKKRTKSDAAKPVKKARTTKKDAAKVKAESTDGAQSNDDDDELDF